MIINGEPDMVVVDSAANGLEAVARYEEHAPDVTLMDLQLPEMGGVDAIRAIRERDASARIIVLTMYKGDEDIYRAMAAGASTYLLKDTLADDLPRIVREGLRMIINGEPDMVVVGAAATGREAIERFQEHAPDITLMDLQLPEMGGVDAIRAIRQMDANARIIVLTMYKGDEDIHRALAAGASTYLLKDTLADDLPRIVREVHAGRQTLPADVQAKLEERAASPTLTPREVEVIRLVAAGRRDKEIAVALSISSQTARVHMKNIFAKLGVSDRTEAMSVAIRRGIIHID